MGDRKKKSKKVIIRYNKIRSNLHNKNYNEFFKERKELFKHILNFVKAFIIFYIGLFTLIYHSNHWARKYYKIHKSIKKFRNIHKRYF